MAQTTRIQTDLVTIRFRNVSGARFITGFCVIGSSSPCQGFLTINRRVGPAANCLLRNGFVLIGSSRNAVVYQRNRIV
ncbi:hypothetical protein [Paenibacillus radicis (ex Xue et al. 2023)]|uniref:Uncharacterized protein n=1 Tax=Paenibacillus radicis (ex Xue et al. 2023) TaxID=2972489 RepID=A0ABT1YP59_9BACL|nr:hypothetical protein [Paenibacillus radicis (ex Xue et al. 2023)]MCR8634169.1 hypothetical protein [Paenibacillus radicis (ex Xue et al. 2023)]